MEELLAFSTHQKDLFLWEQGEIQTLLYLFDLKGLELLPVREGPQELRDYVVGVHLPFQPVWLPFWLEDKVYLREVFPGEENIIRFYGGKRPEDFVVRVTDWLLQALDFSPAYVVIHVSHCGVEEVFSLRFRYDSRTVLKASAELLNAIWERVPAEYKEKDSNFLFENLWWPGLTLMEPWEVEYFFSELKIPIQNLGLVLDTGHLLNASYLSLYPIKGPVSSAQALLLLTQRISFWPTIYKELVQVVHLNFSPHSELFEPDEEGYQKLFGEHDPLLRFSLARKRVLQMDPHQPFEGVDLRPFLDKLNPRYVIHELRFAEAKELVTNLVIQRSCLNSGRRNKI